MSVVTVEKYRVVTGDYVAAASAIQPLLDMAEEMMEEELGRTFAHGTYTETLPVWPFGFVYPRAVPIESVSSSASGATVYDEASIAGALSDEIPSNSLEWVGRDRAFTRSIGDRIGIGYEPKFARATITYTGGWTADTMPAKLQWWVSKLAQALLPSSAGVARPEGSTMARVGDVQVSYNREHINSPLDQFVPGISRAIKGYYLRR